MSDGRSSSRLSPAGGLGPRFGHCVPYLFLTIAPLSATAAPLERRPMSEMQRPEAGEGDRQAGVPADPMAQLNEMLVAQTLTLDGMFTDLTEYCASNFEAWPGPTERFIRLALRAQSNFR